MIQHIIITEPNSSWHIKYSKVIINSVGISIIYMSGAVLRVKKEGAKKDFDNRVVALISMPKVTGENE